MIIDTDHLTNQIHAEVEGVAKTGFPLDAYPEAIQKIVHELVTYENFNLEYSASIILSVLSTAIGNTLRLNIKGKWTTNCALYMILVGRPGLGKTPPLNYLYSPIRDYDMHMLDKARQEYELYKKQSGNKKNDSTEQIDKPHFPQTIISDFTQEAMLSIHHDTPRGITLLVDEIIALFNSANRYSGKSTIIQDLLSAYSGNPLKAVRKTDPLPLSIPTPCINIIGSIQTGLLGEIFKEEFIANGLLDRFLLIYPKNRIIPEWQLGIDTIKRPDTMKQWTTIVKRILSLPLPRENNSSIILPKELKFTEEAQKQFYAWNNHIIGRINSIENDSEVESRFMKLNGNAARLALILQVMRWAVGESPLDNVDAISVTNAIRLIDYYEESYRRILTMAKCGITNGNTKKLLALLNDTFTSKEAEEAGAEIGVSRRTVYNMLDKECKANSPMIIKLRQGVYSKKVKDCTSARCTSALSDSDIPASSSREKVQSAEVQNATDAQKGGRDE